MSRKPPLKARQYRTQEIEPDGRYPRRIKVTWPNGVTMMQAFDYASTDPHRDAVTRLIGRPVSMVRRTRNGVIYESLPTM